MDALAAVLNRRGVADENLEKLLRAWVCHRQGKKVSDGILSIFQEISGAGFHYSQEGEDIVLARILPPEKIGFFVDVGAHHPLRFSNTYALYRQGWRGINVDATPGSMEAFKKIRPDDINLEAGVSDSAAPITFHVFRESALNTLSSSLADLYVQSGYERVGTVKILPRTLASILDEYLPRGKSIDLLSVDVEGAELAVLQSNDWVQYHPQWIILEALATPFTMVQRHPSIAFLSDKGYEPVSRLMNSVILHSKS